MFDSAPLPCRNNLASARRKSHPFNASLSPTISQYPRKWGRKEKCGTSAQVRAQLRAEHGYDLAALGP